jgi:hypothetical protein
MDGVKFLERANPGEFVGKLKAYTYPEEFEKVLGIDFKAGMSFYEQPPQSFNLSYRTMIGNDVDGDVHGYKIHLLYNLRALADTYTFATIDNSASLNEFVWALTGTPPKIDGIRPTVHYSFDSTRSPVGLIDTIEAALYGTSTSDPYFPTVTGLFTFLAPYDDLVITDNGDGTWTATDLSGTYISMASSAEFVIDGADATYIDPDTYTISSTDV